MRILVTGGHGQLAQAFERFWTGHEMVLAGRDRLDLSDPASIRRAVAAIRPDVVINAGAFTQVDLCEGEAEAAMTVNGLAVGWLAEACGAGKALLVQISSDYIFDGKATVPYGEADPPAPLSAYGRSKWRGEQEARRAPEHLVIRSSWLYDAWGRNFYRTMLGLAAEGRPIRVVDDQRGTPTSCRALARQVQVAVEAGVRGVLNATCQGETTWYGFAAELFRQCGVQADLRPCASGDFPRPAPRPAYSVLSGELRGALGVDVMPPWTEALGDVVAHP